MLLLLLGVLLARLSARALGGAGVPSILLELGTGFLIGNLLLPFDRLGGVGGIAELGVISLFFLVGLETRGDLLSQRRGDILRTVLISSLAPLLFYLPLQAITGGGSAKVLLFLAVVAATGTGVTLRALANLKAMGSPSARLLVGVSVLDDLPAVGLLALAASVGASQGAASATPPAAPIWIVVALAAAALGYGLIHRWVRRHGPRELGPFGLMVLMVGCAAAGEAAGLTAFLGALVGGVLLARLSPADAAVERNLAVFSDVFVPLYFVTVGMQVKLETLLQPEAWRLGALLIAIAVISKLLCYFGVGQRARQEGVDPWVVVFGLIPRGLPGLVFATSALKIGLISDLEFSALVIMVTSTTVLGLLLLGLRLRPHSTSSWAKRL
ncbi:cation:proton antiporter [Synechococcus sp. CS-1325]|uniref:cation:proton antiporter n=1 Tax=Synechococcus sp. CS-1324 TaxID=2847980 RepID=UPI00223ABE4A|nr:cation:proton antiporter [Synechococcus sp. CS-1324]MCT0198452.1 cation:proton antiporter [Synechococcus sp. CS-1325]MCT0213572.1 cation:proton antiporter [Synechococcus sp. CS-1326]MCT0230386.1 cation:proton antiporter [Synechococcus sp. CS-1324]MCT0232163.1 cation:proton antiporter [Synechococcus sp. CS-1327]